MNELQPMNFFEISLIVSILLLIYHLIYMKMILSKNGLKVNWFSEWISDYKRLKGFIESKSDAALKRKYTGILWGVKFSALLLLVVVFCGLMFTTPKY